MEDCPLMSEESEEKLFFTFHSLALQTLDSNLAHQNSKQSHRKEWNTDLGFTYP